MSRVKKEKIFVYGASGHAKVVVDVIEKQARYEVNFLIDDDPVLKGRQVYGYTVVGGRDELLASEVRKGIVAIGSNQTRHTVSAWLAEHGFERVTAVHPSAQLARGVTLGCGTVIMAGAVINSDTSVGCDAIVNTRASIDHDCTIGDAVHIAPGSILCGTVMVGEKSFVCAGATVIPNLTIGKNATVGAGSVVIRNVPDYVTVAGSPAKMLKRK